MLSHNKSFFFFLTYIILNLRIKPNVTLHFSESSDYSVMAYYISEFSVPEAQVSAVDEAIGSFMRTLGPGQTRRLSLDLKPALGLHITNMMSAGNL